MSPLLVIVLSVALGMAAAVSLWLRLRVVPKSIGFAHPASGAGGGGERVLWVAIQHLLSSNNNNNSNNSSTCPVVILYTSRFPPPTRCDDNGTNKSSNNSSNGNDDDAECTRHLLDTLLPKQFGIHLTAAQRKRLVINYIPLQTLQDPNIYPIARLFLQSIVGGAALALGVLTACLLRYPNAPIPSLIIDTVGIPFSYPWFRAALLGSGTRVGCYVHYPYISSDMQRSVELERAMPNNPTPVVGVKKALKMKYYAFMVFLYRWLAGYAVNGPIWTNSTWTRNHIVKLWTSQPPSNIRLLFPPVNVERFLKYSLERSRGASGSGSSGDADDDARPVLICVGQFRPEKDHPLLLRAFARALATLRKQQQAKQEGAALVLPKLVVIGGARNQDDRDRAASLRQLAEKELDLVEGEDVVFSLNAPFAELEEMMQRATIGLHTMRDEHFGIVVVEYMASGCVAVAHRSAGPAEIISDKETGFLCETEEEYSNTIVRVVTDVAKDPTAFDELKNAARRRVLQFSDAGFAKSFVDALLL